MELSSRFLSRFDVVLVWCFVLLTLLLASCKKHGTISELLIHSMQLFHASTEMPFLSSIIFTVFNGFSFVSNSGKYI